MLIESLNVCAGAAVRIEVLVDDVISWRGMVRGRGCVGEVRSQARHHWVATATPANRESMLSASVVASA